MNYTIWQLKKGKRDYLFMDFKFAKEHGFSITDYEQVYKGNFITKETDVERILGLLFCKFNIGRPSDFKGHSLSVSDIVVLGEDKYYCDEFGWKKL